MPTIAETVAAQRAYFKRGETRDPRFRYETLERLRRLVADKEEAILAALRQDLRKPEYEGYSSEVGIVLDELKYVKSHLASWCRPRRVRTPLFDFPAKTVIHPEPYGVAAILAPWNYPFQLLVSPLIGALAAGNTAVVKPSELAPATAELIAKLIGDSFPPEYLAVVTGEADAAKELLEQPLDYIFFTGSTRVGRLVMRAAAERLVPVTLELGGKSPAVVDRDARLEVTARRLAWGKFINAGQTCIAPDYVLAHREVVEPLLDLLKSQIEEFYGADPRQSPDYARIINESHFDRLVGLIDPDKLCVGGDHDRDERYIAPTILRDVDWEDPAMEEEIFGPLLPVLTFDSLDEAVERINERPRPLALYYFGETDSRIRRVIDGCPFGGGCVNETVMHIVTPYAPFGGVGASGMGAYHGRWSFDTFTHYKTVLTKSSRIDIKLRYPPYDAKKLRWTKRFMG